jgi:hypothetical protein
MVSVLKVPANFGPVAKILLENVRNKLDDKIRIFKLKDEFHNIMRMTKALCRSRTLREALNPNV